MKSPLFNRVAILGLGLIGGSLALDLRARQLAREVVGYNRSPQGRRIALRRKACDRVFSDPREAVKGADLVVLATPVRHIPRLTQQIAGKLDPGTIVTDVGSTKEGLVTAIKKMLPKTVIFVGGHPVAGTEKTGMASAERNLFAGRWWLLTPTGPREAFAVKRLISLIKAIGAKPGKMSPAEHDQILGAVSHLPHMVAFSLVDSVGRYQKGKAIRFAGGSFRDFTRVAASSPRMWRDICLENRKAILAWIRRFEGSLGKLKRDMAKGRADSLEAFFSKVSGLRKKL